MEFDARAAEPGSAAPRERGRLGDLGEAEDAAVEGAEPVLAAGRGRELDVVHASDHGCLRT
ncbi:hypothetical protein ACFQY7_48875 [Actinomadura luteofluorescens]|uniref:hypothetical protein n=1 Tax=Actinomadura luteofluorescens TaxID=46163 RepID=UPI003636BAED